MRKILCLCLLAVLAAYLGGCCKQSTKEEPIAPAPKAACPPVQAAEGLRSQAMVFPGESASMIRLERIMPGQIRAGQPFGYDIVVTNLTNSNISEVTVIENLGENFAYKSSTPAGKLDGKQLTWGISNLGAKAVERITVNGVVEKAGKLAQCADVKYKMPACSMIDVVSPELTLTKAIPAESSLCNNIPVRYVVTNKGTGVAQNVVITDQLPAGLVTVDGKKAVSISSCPLGPGQKQEYTIMVRAEKPGDYSSKASVKADEGLSAESEAAKVAVHQAELAIAEKTSETGYMGRPIKSEITVSNKGDTAAANTMLVKKLPVEAKFISASDGGNYSGGMITWKLGSLNEDASKTVSAIYAAEAAGTIKSSSQVTAECAAAATATSQTQVKGIAAILLEVVDVSDPILKGENETYVIKVTNQGSATDTNIKIVASMESGVQYVSSSGTTQGTAEGQKVTFAALPNLAPKAVATWQVIVKGSKTGDTRFRVDLTSDQLGSTPVMETESTNWYE